MPRVPIYQNRVQERGGRTQSLQGGASASSFGLGEARLNQQIAQGVGQMGSALAKAQMVSDDRRDRVLARTKGVEAREKLKKYMLDLQNKKGNELFGKINAHEKAKEDFNTFKREFSDQLENDNQREYFDAAYDNMAASKGTQVYAYQEGQRRELDIKSMYAENQGAVDDVISQGGFAAKEALSETLKRIELNVGSIHHGMGKVKDAEIEKAKYNAIEMVSNAMAVNNPQMALDHVKDPKNAHLYNPATRGARIEKLEAASGFQFAYDKALEISNSGMSLEDQLKEVDKIKDAKNAKTTRQMVKSRFQEKESIKKIASQKRFETEFDSLVVNPFEYKVPLELESSQQEKLMRIQDRLKKHELAKQGGGSSAKTNWDTYLKLVNLPPEELRQINLGDHVDDLNGAEIKELSRMQRKPESDTMVKPFKLLNNTMKGLGDEFDIRAGGEESALRVNRLSSEFAKRIRELPEQDRTEDKAMEIIDGLLGTVDIDEGFFDFGETRYRFEVPYLDQADQVLAYKDNIPESLKGYSNLNFIPEETFQDREGNVTTYKNVYYTQGDGVIRIFDRRGRQIDQFKKR